MKIGTRFNITVSRRFTNIIERWKVYPIMIILFSTILCFSCNKDETNIHSTKDPVYIQNDSIQPNVSIIDNIGVELISDSIDLASGVYQFEYKESPVTFKDGDIIVGHSGLGYLRKVSSSTISGNTVTLQTEQATLEDLFVNADVNFEIPFSTSSGNNLKSLNGNTTESSLNTIQLANGVSLEEGEGINLSLSNITLAQGDVSVKINEASISINPNLKYNHSIKWGEVEHVKLTSYGTTMKFNYNFSVNGSFSDDKKYEYTLAHVRHPLPPIGILSFALENKVKLVYTPQVKLGVDFNYQSNSDYVYDLGAIYENETFSPILEQKSKSSEVLNSTFSMSAGGTMKLELIYEPTLLIYSIDGPYLKTSLYGEMTGAISTANDWNLNMGFGLASVLGIDVKIYGKQLVDVSRKFDLSDPDILVLPKNIEKVTGDNQTGKSLEQLSDTLKVKVTDNYGNGVSGVKVYFNPSEGSGTTDLDHDFTDEQGMASATWTLGDKTENQTLLVNVKKADGSMIDGAPLTFNAEATTTEPDTIEYVYFTDNRDGEVYKTVQIGEQIWMAENLRYNAVGSSSVSDVWQNYPTSERQGRLYNWELAMKSCPDGWHLATYIEYEILANTLGGREIAGDKLKEAGSSWGPETFLHLGDSENQGTNESGFSAIPVGSRLSLWTGGNFLWYNAISRLLWGNSSELHKFDRNKEEFLSVRCIKD